MKMIDIWLIFCLVVPFLEVILRTVTECVNCNCCICEPTDAKVARESRTEKKGEGASLVHGDSLGEATRVWVGTSKVAPEHVLVA